MLEVNIYIANLTKYTEGYLVGEWVSLPMDETDLKEKLSEILRTDEEYAIHDYENVPFRISEYENVFELNNQIDELEKYDYELIEALMEVTSDIEETTKILESGDYTYIEDVQNENELALKVDECYLPFDYEAVKEAGADLYIDWEEVSRTMLINGNWFIASNNIAVQTY